jgi:uncharacterized membrane protein YczE
VSSPAARPSYRRGWPETRRRLPQLVVGLVICGVGIATMVAGDLGLGPWDVFHQGVTDRTGIPIGTVTILVGAVVLICWIPLHERLGAGTVLNMLLIGITVDAVLLVLDTPGSHVARWALMLVGPVLMAFGSGLYIGAGLGPGPRDGVMTALARRGHSVRVVRTGIELAALAGGWLLGGTVGVGTIWQALSIGPLVHVFLEWFTIPEPDTEPGVLVQDAHTGVSEPHQNGSVSG